MSPGLLKSQKLAVLLLLAATGNGLYAQASRLSLSTNTLEFSLRDAQAESPSQTVLVKATEGPLIYQTEVGYVSTDTGWLSVSPGAETPSKFVVNVSAQNLPNGLYMGFVKLTSGSNESAFVTVTLNVGSHPTNTKFFILPSTVTPSAVTPVITVTPSGDLVFPTTINGPIVSRTITVSSSVPGGFYIISSGIGGWLNIPYAPDDFQTPAQLTFTASPAGFQNPTTLGGTLAFVGFGGLSGVNKTLTATMNLTAGTGGGSGLTTNPTGLQPFTQLVGGPAPAAQALTVSSGTQTAFTATATSTPSGWLTVTPVSGTTNGTVNVSVSAAGLVAGTYSGSVAVTGGTTTITLPVTFTVQNSTTTTVTATPSSVILSQTVGAATPVSQTVNLSSTTPVTFTATSSASWLTVTSATNTPNSTTLTVLANASSLAIGTYQGTITVNGGTVPLTIAVTFNVVTVAPTLTSTPQSLSLAQILGETPPGGQIVVDSLLPTSFIATSNATWLTVTPSNATTPATLTIFVNQSLLAAGTYQAAITVAGGTTPITVPVTLTISGAVISATPTALSFSQTIGAPIADSQALRINSSSSTNFSISSNTNWLKATPVSSVAPGSVTVSINPVGLAAGPYQGTLTVSTSFITFDVPVTLTVSPSASTITLQPEVLTFSGASGGAAPIAQTVNLTSPGSQFPFTVAGSTIDGGKWLTVSPISGTTPAALTVSVNTSGMQAGQYTGAVTITPADSTVSTRVISVTLTLTGSGTTAVIVRSLVNAASLQPGPLAPGEIITIFGSGLGSALGINTSVSSAGAVGSVIGDTRILFDGVPAPLLYVRADQINAIVPYGLHGRFATSFQVEVAGARSEQLQLRVETASPAIFTMSGSGKGQGAVVNQDGTVNSPLYPAPRDSIIAIYGTGEGQTRPAGQDGRIITTDVRPPLAAVSVKIAGIPADVKYAGSAPGLVSGVFQLNVSVPSNTPIGGQIPIEITIGGILSQLGATVAVK